MEMVEGGIRAEVASVLSEKLPEEPGRGALSGRRLGLDVLSVALHPRAIWPKRGTDLASATGVEPRWADVHAGAIFDVDAGARR